MAATTTELPSTSTATPRPTSYRFPSPPPRISFRKWLIIHRFHLMSAVLLSSTAVTVYRMYEQRQLQDEMEQRSSELDTELSKVQRLTERRRQMLQQQLHSLWASPLTTTVTSSAFTPATAQPSGGWLSWGGWKRWWQGSGSANATTSNTLSTSTLASLQLPLCGSSIHLPHLTSLPATPPSTAYITSVISDCDYLLHTGTLPSASQFNTPAVTASTSTPAPSSSAASTGSGVVVSQSGQSGVSSVTGGGKRLLV